MYAYVENNPVNLVDPYGKQCSKYTKNKGFTVDCSSFYDAKTGKAKSADFYKEKISVSDNDLFTCTVVSKKEKFTPTTPANRPECCCCEEICSVSIFCREDDSWFRLADDCYVLTFSEWGRWCKDGATNPHCLGVEQGKESRTTDKELKKCDDVNERFKAAAELLGDLTKGFNAGKKLVEVIKSP